MSQAPMIHSEEALAQAVSALVALDPVRLAPLVDITGLPPLRRRPPGFDGLVWIIISQQVSVASANAIFARVKARFEPLLPQDILSAGDETLRGCGLSAPKIRSLTALSHALVAGTLDLDHLEYMPATEAHQALVAIKGIGPWTAAVFLLFCLGHAGGHAHGVWPCAAARQPPHGGAGQRLAALSGGGGAAFMGLLQGGESPGGGDGIIMSAHRAGGEYYYAPDARPPTSARTGHENNCRPRQSGG